MACKTIVNGQESILFNNIVEAYNGDEELATTLHNHFSSSDFIKYFGDWKSDYESDIKSTDYNYNKEISRIEDNGEPKLFKNESTGNYYYIDKYRNKEYIIFNSQSLNSVFTFAEIKQLTEVLSFNFIKNNINLDFENINLNTNIGSTLREAIVNKINERITAFNKTEDYLWEDKAELLQQALDNNLDEIVNNVKNYFQQSKLEYHESTNENLEDTDLENIETAENEKDPGFGIASFERSTKDNISANVKLRLSLIEDVSQKDYFLNDITYVKFDEIYSTLLNNLNSKVALDINEKQEDSFNIYKEEIAKLINKKPYFKELYRILSKPDLSDDIKSEFVQAFNLDKQAYNTSITEDFVKVIDNGIVVLEDGTYIKDVESYDQISHKVLDVANVGSRETEVFSQWNNNFKKLFVSTEKSGKNIISPEKRELLKLIKVNINKSKDTRDIDLLVDSLRDLGVETTVDGFQHYLDKFELINNDTELSDKLFDSAVTNLSFFIDRIISNKNTKYNDVLTDQSLFRDLATAEAFYISEGSDSSVYTAGKQKWTYSYPSYLSTTIKMWKKDRNVLLNHYESSKYSEGSDWMKYLLALGDTYEVNEWVSLEEQTAERVTESKNRINQLHIASFNVAQENENASAGLDNKSIDKSSYIADTINKVLSFTKNSKSYYRTTTPADKGTQYELFVGRNHSTNARFNSKGEIVINSSSVEVIFDYFNAEYKRMKFEREFASDVKNKGKLSVYYHLGAGNAYKSQIFPSLSFDKIKDEMEKLPIEDRFSEIYNVNGTPSLNDLNNKEVKANIIKYISNELSKNISSTLDSLTTAGVFELNNGEYINKRLDSKIWDNYQRDNAVKAASDFYINSIISHVEYSKMFSGDIAYYKNGVDYKKRVPATYTDGLQLRLNDVNKDYNIAVTESVNIASPFHAEIVELVGEDIASYYGVDEEGNDKINSADAQAWITPMRWKTLFKSLGKWNSIYESSYQKLIGNDLTPFTAEELKKVAPPVKGVYFQVVNGKPIFLKYSQAVLSPRLRKGNGLQKLYDQMIVQGVDELMTFDAIKVGSNLPTKVNDDNGNVLDDITFNVMNIPSNGWKLQQDLPVKTFKETEVGSQIQKNIFQGLAFNLSELFQLDNTEYSGNEIIEKIADIVGALSNKGYEKVLKEFGIGSDGIITNIEGFYKSISDELKAKGGSSNVIKALEAETSIYGIPQAQSKLQNIFGSIMNSRILKIKTNGGSFIQMSNFGLTKENAEAQGVIWSPNALSTTHEPQFLKDKEGKFILSESGKRIVRPGGILISGSFIAKYIPDYRKYTSEELFISYKGGTPIIDKRIQENIIGYRIPNQGLSSNDALEIVGILPEENGDTVVAYTGITTKTGSDFDVDKMYIMFPSYNPIYNNRDEIYQYVNKTLSGSNKAETVSNYLEFLNSFNNISDQEVDIESIKDHFDKLSTNEDKYNFFNTVKDQVVDILSDTANSDNPFVKDIFSNFNIEVKGLRYVKYNETEPTLKGLQNRLIELYKSVLTNETVIKDVMTPIDFDHMKKDIRSIFKQLGITNLSLYDPIQDIETKYSFLAGKAGVGQEANALIDYVLGSLSNISVSNFEIAKSNSGKLDHEYSQELDNNDWKYYQKELKLSNDQIEGLKKIKISHSLSAILNAFVDIAKDPYITEGNWVTMTTNTGNLLLRKGVHPFYVNALLAQPIIKKYIDFTEQYEKSEDQSLSTRDEFRKQYVKEQLQDKDFTLRGAYTNLATMYDDLLQDSDINSKKAKDIKKGNNSFTINNILGYLKLGEIALSPSEIIEMREIEGIITETHSKIFFPSERDIIENNSLETIRKNIDGKNIEFQAKVFNDFLRYQNASKAVKVNIDGSKFMVNGMGKNVTSLNIAKNIVDSILHKEQKYVESDEEDPNSFRGNTILGFSSKFKNPNGSESMFSKYYNNVILGVQNIVKANPKLFLSANSTVQNTFDEISYNIYEDILIDDKLGTQLEKDFYSYTMSGFTPFQVSVEERRDLITKFPERFREFKEAYKGVYEIIDQLTIKSGESFDFISLNNRKKSVEFEETLTNSWYDLMREEPELSNDLIKYSFFTSGFAMSISQFYTYIPSQWFIENKINRFVIDQSNEYSNQTNNIDNFIDQFYMSNIEDRSRVKMIKPFRIDLKNELTSLSKGFISKKSGRADYFVVRKEEDTVIYYKLLGYNTEMKGVYSRFIPNINGELVDIRALNVQDKRGNKVVNFNTEGLILKPSTPTLVNIIDKSYYDLLSTISIYPRDYFFREDYVNNKKLYFDTIEEGDSVEDNNIVDINIVDINIVDINIVDNRNKITKVDYIITRNDVRNNPKNLYLFGDNDIRKGLGGQAKEMRGESNTVGISTKKLPANTINAFKNDNELDENKKIITKDINKVINIWNSGKYDNIIIPPIGIGLAKLEEKAPLTWNFLQEEFSRLENTINNSQGQLSLFDMNTPDGLPSIDKTGKC